MEKTKKKTTTAKKVAPQTDLDNALKPLVERLEKLEEKTSNMMSLASLDDEIRGVIQAQLGDRFDELERRISNMKNNAEEYMRGLEKRLNEMPIVTQQTADELRDQAQALRETVERIENTVVDDISSDTMPIAQHAAAVVDVVDEVRRRAAEPGTDSRTRRMEARRTNRHNH